MKVQRPVHETNAILTYWLCPAEPARTEFAALIATLATRFDAAVFEPHVTIYVTSAEQEKPDEVLTRTVPGLEPVRLTVLGLDYADKFTKTLFVRFAADAELARLKEDLRRASASPNDYELNPHLSLLYKKMNPETQRELAESVTPPFTEVVFDKVKAVISPAEIKSCEDVEAWRVVAEQELGR